MRARTTNAAFERISKMADEVVRKSGSRVDDRVAHAQAVAKILATPEGRRLYAQGQQGHNLGYYETIAEEDSPARPLSKREAEKESAWEQIRSLAERIQKGANGGPGTSFAKAVDRVLAERPDLYEQYVGRR